MNARSKPAARAWSIGRNPIFAAGLLGFIVAALFESYVAGKHAADKWWQAQPGGEAALPQCQVTYTDAFTGEAQTIVLTPPDSSGLFAPINNRGFIVSVSCAPKVRR